MPNMTPAQAQHGAGAGKTWYRRRQNMVPTHAEHGGDVGRTWCRHRRACGRPCRTGLRRAVHVVPSARSIDPARWTHGTVALASSLWSDVHVTTGNASPAYVASHAAYGRMHR